MHQIKIGLIGYGRAGKSVANIFRSNERFSLEWIFKRSKHASPDRSGEVYSAETTSLDWLIRDRRVDVIVDFSSAQGLRAYGEAAAELGVKIVSAVSHYGKREQELLKRLAERTVVFWSPNITLGVNFLIVASKLLQQMAPDADIQIVEEHFRGKKDTSGTALKIAQALDVPDVGISSVRAGGIVGKHEVIFGFPYQTVRLVHESIAREAFGNGAVFVIRELLRSGAAKGFFTFEQLLAPYMNRVVAGQ